MTSGSVRKWGLIALTVLLVLIVGCLVGFRVGIGILKEKMVEALGSASEITAIRVRWSSVEVEGLRIKGQTGWPAAEELWAERVVVVPSLRSVFSGQFRVHSMTLVKPYLSALRTKDGQLLVVPSLPAPSLPPVIIDRITLQDGVVELFDATVARPPLKIRLEQIQATVRDVVVPALTGRSRFDLAGVVKGVQRDGRATVAGWAEIATRDSSVKTQLRSVDLVELQTYLIKVDETGVRKGVLDLDLESDVSKDKLKAPGKVTISDLELAPAKGAFGTFMGVPRDAVVAFLKHEGNKITVNFVLAGDINNPQFSLNEALSTRVAFSLAETLGVSLGGVAKEVGTLGGQGLAAAGQAVKGAGGALQRLFGGSKKP